ncbi:MAG: asparagine synthase, partial [Chloroflexi bacterium]|nr:asparagine synthase [Chloroflexota bacterium]
FGSMARQVLAHGAVPARLNERAIAYYLTGKPYNFLTEGTYFEGIWRVRPAHTLALTQSGEARQTRYWDIDRGRQLRYNSDQAYAEELLHLLEQAVKAQSRSQRPVAVLTSGGMDSSLVACLLGKLRQEGCGVDFQLVSFVYGESHSADERQYISHIATHCGTVVHYVDGLGHLPLSSSPYVGWFDDEPPRYWNDPLWHATFVQVAQLGCRVALLGQGGDSLFTVHHVLFADLLRQRRLIECVREIRTVSTQYRRRVMELICDQWARTLAPMWLLKLHRRLRRSQLAWVNKDFADPLTDVPDFKWGFPDHGFPSIHQAARYHAISDWLYPVEAAIHRLAVPHGLEPRDPYLYRPLVEFGLALPAEQIYRRGVTKWALRNASHGIVPEPIRLRLDKTTFDTVLRHGLAEWVRMGAQSRVSGWTLVRRGHVNAGRLSEALAAYGAAPTDRAAITLWKPLVLEQWLQFVQAA